MNVLYVHVSLHIVMIQLSMFQSETKKMNEMSFEYLQRATFTIKKVVGGRELTKLWV